MNNKFYLGPLRRICPCQTCWDGLEQLRMNYHSGRKLRQTMLKLPHLLCFYHWGRSLCWTHEQQFHGSNWSPGQCPFQCHCLVGAGSCDGSLHHELVNWGWLGSMNDGSMNDGSMNDGSMNDGSTNGGLMNGGSTNGGSMGCYWIDYSCGWMDCEWMDFD